jgi:hypothetical protein
VTTRQRAQQAAAAHVKHLHRAARGVEQHAAVVADSQLPRPCGPVVGPRVVNQLVPAPGWASAQGATPPMDGWMVRVGSAGGAGT